MFLQDTINKVILRGHYGFYDELKDYAFATDSAFAIEYSQPDTLFIHADTLNLITVIDTAKQANKILPEIIKRPQLEGDSLSLLAMPSDSADMDIVESAPDISETADSIPTVNEQMSTATDTTKNAYRLIKAYYGVRFYRTDVQGVCDSLQVNSKDSILHMYKDPILWNTNRQLSGDTIDIFMNDSTIDRMHIKNAAFSIEQKDSIHFNQLKSRSLKIFFEGKKAKRVLAEGSVETIVYPEEKDGSLSFILNWLQSSYLEIFLNDGAFEKLVVWPKPVGKTTPFHLVKTEQLRLRDFYWYDYLRPVDKDDIFRKSEKRATDIKPVRSSVFDRVDELEFD